MRIIKNKRDIFIKIPLGFVLIIVFSISPILISIVGSWLTELITKQPCNESNCFWGAFGWLFLFTIPAAGVLFVIFLILAVIDIVKLSKAGKSDAV